jgi:hypothetical protein
MARANWYSGFSLPLPSETRCNENLDTGWSRGTQILGATWKYVTRTGYICYQYKNRDAYRFWYTVYCQFVMDLRRLTDTFDKWITLVYTQFKNWDNLQRYELTTKSIAYTL